MKMHHAVPVGAALMRCAASLPLSAQGPGGRGGARPMVKAPLATPMHEDSMPVYVRRDTPTDAVMQRIWQEGMERSMVASIGQTLLDSIGPRGSAARRP